MKLITLLVLFCVLAAGCRKFDNEPPVIKYLTVNNATEDIVLGVNQAYPFSYRVEDNEFLKWIQFKVVKGFKHERNPVVTAGDYFYSNGLDPDNPVKEEPLPLDIPNNVTSGTYRLVMEASDLNDNAASPASVNFVIINPAFAPSLDANLVIDGADQPPLYYARRGDRIYFQGTASAAQDITQLKIDMVSGMTNVLSGIIEIPGPNDTQVDIAAVTDSTQFVIPATAERGIYQLILSATASNGHTTPRIFRINVII